jgi:hypothetical protein
MACYPHLVAQRGSRKINARRALARRQRFLSKSPHAPSEHPSASTRRVLTSPHPDNGLLPEMYGP